MGTRILATMATMVTLLGAGGAMAGSAVLDGPGNGASLRAGPDPLYEAVFSAADGTRVETLEATLSWTLVRLPNGATGWVPNAHLVAPGAWQPEPEADGEDAATDVAATPDMAAPEIAVPEIKEVKRYTSVVWPEAGRLNLRAGPGEDFEVVSSMERGDWVAVMALAGPWVKVEHESGVTGWAHGDFLTR